MMFANCRSLYPLTAILLLATILRTALAVDKTATGEKAAVVNGAAITRAQYDRELNVSLQRLVRQGRQIAEAQRAELAKEVFKGLIEREILYQESQKAGIKIDDQQITDQMTDIKKRFPDEEAFNKAMASMDLTEDEVETQILRMLAIRQLIRQSLGEKPDDNDVRLYINQLINDAEIAILLPSMKELQLIGRKTAKPRAKAKVEAASKGQELVNAAAMGKMQRVRSLIERGVDVNSRRHSGATALFMAAQTGHEEIVSYLLTHGADINASTNRGATPLHAAIESSDAAMVNLLISQGADIHVQGTKKGFSPLHLAAQYGSPEIALALITQGANVNARNRRNDTPLHVAAAKNHHAVAEILLSKGADVNAKGFSGAAPIYLAAQFGHDEVIKVLIAYKANVNAPTDQGYTPLGVSLNQGYAKTASLLRRHGAKE